MRKLSLTHYYLAVFVVTLVSSEDDRDLSTDILEYVLKRGQSKQDQTWILSPRGPHEQGI